MELDEFFLTFISELIFSYLKVRKVKEILILIVFSIYSEAHIWFHFFLA